MRENFALLAADAKKPEPDDATNLITKHYQMSLQVPCDQEMMLATTVHQKVKLE